jgi:drug/metabolite transporter (DMT)-like permease
MRTPALTVLKLSATAFFWGGTFVAGKWAVREAPPFSVALLRFAGAAVVLFGVLAWKTGKAAPPARLPFPRGAAQWAGLLSLGLTGMFLYNFFFLKGLSLTTAANGSLIVSLNPLITALLSAALLKERIRPARWLGLLTALAGVGVVVTDGDPASITRRPLNPGDLLLLGAPLMWAFYTVIGKKVLERIPPLAATAYAALFGTLLLLPAAAVEAPLHRTVSGLTPWGWLSVLQLALLGTVVGFVWWYDGVAELGAARAAVFVYLVPLFGVLLASLVLSEPVGPAKIAGGLLIVGGVYAGTLGEPGKAPGGVLPGAGRPPT